MTPEILVAEPWADYGLVDSGGGRKLERYGRYRFIRPDPQALWAPASPDWMRTRVPRLDEEGAAVASQARPARGLGPGWEEVRYAPVHAISPPRFFPDMAPQGVERERLRAPNAQPFGLPVCTLAMAAKARG